MANPTTNYGFVLPTPTDLVTDLPADFEVALQGVDTQMKTNADAATQKATLTTKGDIYAATGTSTPARLAVGTNGQALIADSTAATGLKWDTPAAGGMTLLSTTTLSGASTTISSISQSYNSLVGVIYGITNATNNGPFIMRPNNSTTIASYVGFDMYGTFGGSIVDSFQQLGQVYLGGKTNSIGRTDSGNSFSFQIDNYASTTNYKPITAYSHWKPNDGDAGATFLGGGLNTNSAISSLVFVNTGGNFSTGTVLLYGVK